MPKRLEIARALEVVMSSLVVWRRCAASVSSTWKLNYDVTSGSSVADLATVEITAMEIEAPDQRSNLHLSADRLSTWQISKMSPESDC
ncbi:Hypothetical protein AT6N2_L2419 [Agrobacterium tumefaciens]|nr:Hypothetical protein AT6N2_L2419 [Agrobacterium tumefaciens]